MLTSDGATYIWQQLQTQANNWRIAVYGPGGEEAVTPVSLVALDGREMTLTGQFGPSEANFEWVRRTVLAADGTPIDTLAQDAGRKVIGAVWTVEAVLHFKTIEE